MPSLHDIVTKGATDRSVTVHIMDSTDGTPETGVVFNTSGIAMWYRREGAAVTSITEVTLAALTTAHTDGGFLHISDGDYRLDLPDAAFATGANYVDFGGTVTGMIVIGGRVRLIDTSLEVANLTANVIEWHGSDLLTGTGPLAGLGVLDRGTAQSDSTTTLQLRSAAAFANDELNGATALLYSATTGAGQRSLITDYVGSTDTATIDTLVTDPTGTVRYEIYGTAASSGGAGLDAAGVRAALGMASANLDTQLSTIDNFIDTEVAAIQTSLTTIEGKIDTVDNFLDTEMAAVLAAVDTEVAAIQTAVVTTIPGTLTTIAGYLDTEIAAIKVKTDFLPSVTAGAAGGLFIAGTNAATSITTALTANITGNLTGNVTGNISGSVGSVTGLTASDVAAVKAKTDQLTFTKTNEIDANLQSFNGVTLIGNGSSGNEFSV